MKKPRIQFNLLTKLLLSYVSLIVLPLLLVTGLLVYYSSENIKKNTLTYVNLFVEQIGSNIDSYVSEIDRMTKISTIDSRLCTILTEPEVRTGVTAYENAQYLSTYMLKVVTQQPDVQSITFLGTNRGLYTGISNKIKDPDSFFAVAQLNEHPTGFQKLYLTGTYLPDYLIINQNEPVFSVVRQLYTLNRSYVGTVVLNVRSSRLLEAININPSLVESGARIVITNTNHQILADTSKDFSVWDTASHTELAFDLDAQKSANPNNLYFSSTSSESGLTTTVIISRAQLFYSLAAFKSFSFAVVCLLIVILLVCSVYFSFSLFHPIRTLQKATVECANGNYEIQIPVKTQDEIGQLCASFNQMVQQIKNLLQKVYLQQLQTKQSQLEALQNQISPHFLHNTLETIRMKALVNKDTEVANMIMLLARLFRITLDRTCNTVTLKDELEHVKTYLAVQNMRFGNRFHLHVDIPEALLHCFIIKLTLQPIVENCILHGFSETSGDGTIHISTAVHPLGLQILIADDGKGIDDENLVRIQRKLTHKNDSAALQEGHKSIGIVNIAQRIALEYGAEYSLCIANQPPHGTAVTLIIPRTDAMLSAGSDPARAQSEV